MKNIFKFILILLPWFLSSLFFNNHDFYQTLNLPFFALKDYMYGIVWTTLYILIGISIYIIYKNYKFREIKNYNLTLLFNYFFNQLYTFIFFRLQNLFLAFVDTLLIFLTSLYLYKETKELDDKASKFLIPYIIFSLFAFILSITIYFMNL